MSSGSIEKAILLCDAPAETLASIVASLPLPRRAISLPVEPDSQASPPDFSSFIEIWGDIDALKETVSTWPYAVNAWRVRQFVPLAYEQTWPSGEQSPGVRMVSSIQRRPGMSLSEFEAHWRGPHTEVAKSYTVPVWHYNQNVVLEKLRGEISVDGFVGMHFRTAEEMAARWRDYPAEAARGAEDAAKFMATEETQSITALETVWDTRVDR